MFRTPMTLGRAQRLTTTVAVALAIALVGIILATAGPPARFGLAVLVAVLVLSWAMSPCAVVVAGGELRVQRRAWPALRVHVTAIESVTPLSLVSLRHDGAIRLFGVGGFCGSYGLFRTRSLGAFHLYATHGGEGLLVRLRDRARPLLITPDDVTGTLRALDLPARPTPTPTDA
jgi:hypothetical protein